MSELIIPGRFNGPPSSANGGYTAGALAGLIDHHQGDRQEHQHRDPPADHARAWPTVRVALRQPPPLDTPLLVTGEDGRTVATFGGAVVAHAEVLRDDSDDDPAPVEPVPVEEARAAEASYAGLSAHPFGRCFGCGVDRVEGDGLRIFPGRVADLADAVRVAATWTPHPSVAEDYHAYVDDQMRASLPATWTALDCVGGWTGDVVGRPMVLGGMTARVETLPVVGEEHVVVGQALGQEGRKAWTAATLYDSDGRVVATAAHVWVSIDPDAFF